MHSVCRTQLKRTLLFAIPAVLVTVAVLALCVFLFSRKAELMDPNALIGQPTLTDESLGYTELTPQGLCTVRICSAPAVDGKDVYLYLTNPDSNSFLIRAEVYTAEININQSTGETSYVPGELLGKTGFISPGSYVETLELDKPLREALTRAYIKIALRNAETGRSEGFFYLAVNLIK